MVLLGYWGSEAVVRSGLVLAGCDLTDIEMWQWLAVQWSVLPVESDWDDR